MTYLRLLTLVVNEKGLNPIWLLFPQVRKKAFFLLFRVAPAAYGGSQAWGQIGAAAASLHHSHSNGRSKPQIAAVPDPFIEQGLGSNRRPHGYSSDS